MKNMSALAAGIVFGLGLAISQMVNPKKIIGFLDLTGNWDPSLALVMGGAVAVTLIAFRLSRQLKRPMFEAKFFEPEKIRIDAPLLLGSAAFGAGWGLAGYCPGPAIVALSVGSTEAIVFVAAMAAGSFVWRGASRVLGR